MPTIRIDEEVWQYLKGRAVPFEDSPNDVLRREFRLNSSRSTRSARGPKGETVRLVSEHPDYILKTNKMNGALKGLTAKAAEGKYRGQESRNYRQALLEELREVFGPRSISRSEGYR